MNEREQRGISKKIFFNWSTESTRVMGEHSMVDNPPVQLECLSVTLTITVVQNVSSFQHLNVCIKCKQTNLLVSTFKFCTCPRFSNRIESLSYSEMNCGASSSMTRTKQIYYDSCGLKHRSPTPNATSWIVQSFIEYGRCTDLSCTERGSGSGKWARMIFRAAEGDHCCDAHHSTLDSEGMRKRKPYHFVTLPSFLDFLLAL